MVKTGIEPRSAVLEEVSLPLDQRDGQLCRQNGGDEGKRQREAGRTRTMAMVTPPSPPTPSIFKHLEIFIRY